MRRSLNKLQATPGLNKLTEFRTESAASTVYGKERFTSGCAGFASVFTSMAALDVVVELS